MADRERVGREASPSAATSTASRCAPPIKGGLERLRRRQEDQRPQAPPPDRHRRQAARRACPWRRYPRSRRGQRGPEALATTPSLRATGLSDGGYAGRLGAWAKDKTHIDLEIIRRNATAKGMEVLPRRWVVERTFAWIMKNRRFARDYEQLTPVAETLIVIAACATLVRRWP